jgi:hypothetical protein
MAPKAKYEVVPPLFVLFWWGSAALMWPSLWPVWALIGIPQSIHVYFAYT